jgi:hypothetical protein
MPGNSINVGPGASTTPQTNRAQAVHFKPGDEPALASIDHMDTSVPMEPVTPFIPPGEVPHEGELLPEKPPLLPMPPLSDEVSPFKVPEPRVPATEYIQIPMIPDRPAPAPIPPAPAPPVIAAPPATLPTLQSSMPKLHPFTPPVTQPIIVQRPNTRMVPPPQPQPVAPPAPLNIVEPVPPPPRSLRVKSEAPTIAPLPPSPAPTPVESVVAAPAAPPQAVPQSPVLQPTPAVIPAGLPRLSDLSVATEAAQPSTAAVINTVIAPKRPARYFSQNTRDVWRARRSIRNFNVLAIIGICLIIGGLFVCWRSLGSPTHVEDLPIIGSQK